MKKAVSIIVSCLYLLGILQVSLSFHYCGGHFAYISINKVEERESCCGENERRMDGCCDDEVVVYEIDDQLVAHANIIAPKILELTPIILSFYQEIKVFNPIHEVYKVSHSPPLISNLRLHILNCVYLI